MGLLGAAAIAGVLAEIILRVAVPSLRQHFVVVPHTRWTISGQPPLIEGTAHYTINAQGLRGKTFKANHSEFRVLVLGDSAVQCVNQDDERAWTALLERKLDRSPDGRPVVVGGAGGAGFTSRDHVVQLKYLLPQLPSVDLVLVMLGLTDVAHSLRFGGDYRLPPSVSEPVAERRQLRHAFAVQPPDESQPWYRRSALWQMARRLRLRSRARRNIEFQGGLARTLERNRRARRENPVRIDKLPSLTAPLEEYRRNVKTLIELAQRRQVRLVLVTHPALWRAGMSPEEESRLWFGWSGGAVPHARGYFTIAVMAEALAAFDQVLKEVCSEGRVECADLASAIARTTENFYDDAHFTDAGARTVADALARQLSAGFPPTRPHRAPAGDS